MCNSQSRGFLPISLVLYSIVIFTSLRSNVDQYFSRLIERSNESNFVEQSSVVGKAKLSE